jgi:hypothetical protein
MPRGMRGTGPGARKRLQSTLGYTTKSDAYVTLYLTQEEARLIYTGLKALPHKMESREGAVAMNILYRITEQVMLHEMPTAPPSVVKKGKSKKSA